LIAINIQSPSEALKHVILHIAPAPCLMAEGKEQVLLNSQSEAHVGMYLHVYVCEVCTCVYLT